MMLLLVVLLAAATVHGYPRDGAALERELVWDADGNASETGNKSDIARVSYYGSQVWQVAADQPSKTIILAKLRDNKEISTWGGNTTSLDILVYSDFKEHVAETLDKAGIAFEVMIFDVQNAIDVENPEPNEDEEELANRRGHRMTWSAYHRVSDIYGYIDYLAQTYPTLCTVKTIGQSVEGRPIKLLKISNGKADNKAIWIDGGMHAREWISPATVTHIINEIVENYDTESEDVRNLDWYFVPVANPDGYEHTHTGDRLWRKNRARSGICQGVDLNRNFGYKWGGKGASKNKCAETYGGTTAFSEPETVALRNFILSSNANFKAYISFHSYGQYILYPWGYDNVVPPDHKDLQNVGQKAANAMRAVNSAIYKVGPAANMLYPASGGSDDWAKGAANVKYSYTVELRDTGKYGFILPAAYIDTTAKEAMAAVRVFAAAARNA